jgi:hypothetical protein
MERDFERRDKVLETLLSIEDRTRVSEDAQELQILGFSPPGTDSVNPRRITAFRASGFHY